MGNTAYNILMHKNENINLSIGVQLLSDFNFVMA